MFLGRDGFIWWIGVVENTDDPLLLGRARVRIFGYHAPANTEEMPTAELPWAVTLMPANMPDAYGIPNLGEWVMGFFLDGKESQEPCIVGYIPAIPPETIPTDVQEKFSEVITTTRTFKTVSETYKTNPTAQRNRFKFTSKAGNNIEMSDDTSVGTYVHIGHNSGTYYNLEKNALKFGRSLDNTHFQIIENKGMDIQSRSGDIMVLSPVLPVDIENSYRGRSLVPPLEGYSSIGKAIEHYRGPQIGADAYYYYYPSLEDQNPVYDTTNLVKDVRLLMNTVFQAGEVISRTIPGTALPYPEDNGGGGGGGGGGGDCFLGESLVTMSDGTQRRIDQIKDGDYVFNMSRTQINKVLFIEKIIDKYNWQQLYTPSSEFEPFATPNHPLFVDGEWVAMEQGLYPWLEDVNPVKNPITRKVKGDLVYNLWITGDGTYIINGFGTTSIMMNGGIMRVAYQYGYLTQDYIMKLMREFTIQGTEMTHGAYIFNNLFGHITHKPLVKVIVNTIKRERSFLPRKAMIFLMKVFGKTATLYNKLKG